ncbi:MAG: hypothetical protein CVU48_06370 [Candidatus Cloacimonetes bacterium HGW-Cloacimonetes-1]|jgi:hypothetical protein|nr:MAG: hypothetical protein CVU48_06370 [Candidatus Cloacimonetes bacterium HGW-Cloacimonetes-1]
MKKTYIIIAMFSVLVSTVFATKYAGEIFQLTPGVANQAMGNTGLTFQESISAGYWNPALLANSPYQGLELVHTEHFEGLLQQNQMSLIPSRIAHFSLTINHIGIDNIKLTRLENEADTLSNDNRPVVWKTVGNNDFVLYGSFGRPINEHWSMGLSPKLAYRSLADNKGYGFGADLGILWQPNSRWAIGANIRDFFSTQVMWENDTREVVNPNLDLETAYRFMVSARKIPVHIALRSQIFAEGREEASTVSASLLSADFHGGISIAPIPNLRLMAGYDVDSFTAGLGVEIKGLGVDYAYKANPTDGLGTTQRIAIGLKW